MISKPVSTFSIPFSGGAGEWIERSSNASLGGEVVFHGRMDNQHTLPLGSEEDVRGEVVDNLEVLGRGGGYILAPCHNIQPITPLRNILAIYDEGYKRGKLE